MKADKEHENAPQSLKHCTLLKLTLKTSLDFSFLRCKQTMLVQNKYENLLAEPDHRFTKCFPFPFFLHMDLLTVTRSVTTIQKEKKIERK